MESKKKSGAENRKRKAEKELETQKLRGQLNKYFKKAEETQLDKENEVSTSIPSVADLEQNIQSSTSITDSDQNIHPSTSIADSNQNIQSQPTTSTSTIAVTNFNSNDPVTWPKLINSKFRKIIVEKGLQQIKQNDFPRDNSRRSFSNHYYERKLSNGDIVPRSWLVYSISGNCVFCFCCKLFKNDRHQQLSSDGYFNWQNLTNTLTTHEVSTSHLNCFVQWMELKKRLNEYSTVDSMLEKMYDVEKRHWRAVLERIIEMIKYLAGQCLALRGSSDVINEKNNGNFLKLVELLAKFDVILMNHVARITNNETDMVHYLGKNIQNEMICLISNKIVNYVVEMIKNAKYYSILLDCTPDVSHTEQLTIIIRFVHKDEKNIVSVEEHFLGFLPVADSTGIGLSTNIVDKLKQLDLNIKNIRGQGYDNGANMKGKNNGVQKHILNLNPRAFFIPCAAHTLNLTVADAAKISVETISFFHIVQELYNFFSASTKRWDILIQYIKITLKPLCATRWESKVNALYPLRYELDHILDALIDIYESTLFDNTTKHEAKALAQKIKEYEFVCSTIVWYNILSRINVVSKIFQNPNKNINGSMTDLNNLILHIKELRSDEHFNLVLETAKALASDLEIVPQFKDNTLRRRKKRQFDYESHDETPLDPQYKFKISFYFPILDAVINSLDERFEVMKTHVESFQFLTDFKGICHTNDEVLKKYCNSLDTILTDSDEKDISATELFNELKILKDTITNHDNTDPLYVLQYIYSNLLENIFVNITVALRILLSLPVSVASAERSFSKLKIIKNYLRSSISQERLVGLSMIAIEKDICDKIDPNEIIEEFSRLKARKIKF